VSVRFAGYASVFGVRDRGGDVVRKGAFGAPGAVPLLWQHQGAPVGEIERVEEDSRGLSFGYRVREAKGGAAREIQRLDLMEVSLVASPMQPLARVHAVSSSEE
jgi:phage head maturation protease